MTRVLKERFTAEFLEDIVIIRLLDREIHQASDGADDVEAVSREIESLVDSARPGRLLIELSEVEFMASFMQAFLIELQKKLRRTGGRLKLCGMSEPVEESFRVANLHPIFSIHPDERSALDAFGIGR